jgi:hypothetical protein
MQDLLGAGVNRPVCEAQMLDVMMVILGIGAFALFLGYVAVCDRL